MYKVLAIQQLVYVKCFAASFLHVPTMETCKSYYNLFIKLLAVDICFKSSSPNKLSWSSKLLL